MLNDEQRSNSLPSFPDFKLLGNGKKNLLNTVENLCALLEFRKYEVRINAMNLEIEFRSDGKLLFTSLESIQSELTGWCARFGLPSTIVKNHLKAVALKKVEHPIKKVLDKKWDGIKRVRQVISCFNAQDPKLAQVILNTWFIGAIASIYENKFSSKLVPIIKGEQNYMKTSALRRICALCEDSFLEGAELNPDSKDSVLSVISSWITELGELERTSKNCQGAIKAFITKETDTIRPPYAISDIKKPRQTHLIGTVNGTSFLKDNTGNSRYAVISLAKPVNIKKLNKLLGWEYKNGRIERVNPELLIQFWLEVKEYYKQGKTWNLDQSKLSLLKDINNQYLEKNQYYRLLSEKYVCHSNTEGNMKYLKASEVCELESIDKCNAKQVGQALTVLVKEGKIESKKGRSNVVYYQLKISVNH